ncbi:MATE family efflux transporter [Bradyrhizobium sp. BRP14]|nr:MATE family efflux transporter [Bradyrhizobium sp. BRP14]
MTAKAADASFPDEVRATVALSWPLILGQVSQRLLLAINVIMMGHLGPKELAAGTLTMAILNPIMLCSAGILTAVAPLTAQSIGSRDGSGGRHYFQCGLLLAVILSVATILLLYSTGFVLALLGQDLELAGMAGDFAKVLCLMLPPYMVMLVARNFLAAHGQTFLVLLTLFGGAALNFFCCYIVISNTWGLRSLGLAGIGYATALSSAVIAIVVLSYVRLDTRTGGLKAYKGLSDPDLRSLKHLSAVGIPIGGAMLLEVAFFSVSTLLIGYQGEVALAAYALSGQLNGLAFAIPTGIGLAAMVRVGRAYGANSWLALRSACFAALLLGIATAAIVGVTYILFPMWLLSFFMDVSRPENASVVKLSVTFLYFVAVLQFFDAVQGVVSHVLRGISDTLVPFGLVLVGYWALGFPISLLLSRLTSLGGSGVYTGLTIGVGVVAAALTTRLGIKLARLREAAERSTFLVDQDATPELSAPIASTHAD